ncbi:hypothetical protein bsdcttw_41040 [Anaerocolumna chitinilytica]|uniref:Uncharacterized protein n=1 Tax=Anaerocolumna chitinilytica TaxID=1727145 RepID=A0A7I8DRL8_9FIRM|nr:hypothetical protein bsdcttw_41040 [Anaerocolumna chitinilytica]
MYISDKLIFFQMGFGLCLSSLYITESETRCNVRVMDNIGCAVLKIRDRCDTITDGKYGYN